MKRLIPVLIVGAILALAATAGADHRNAPVPASAVTETTSALAVLAPNVKRTPRKLESPRQKAHRIIAATWPASQVENAMRVVKCETGGTYSQWALGDGGNSVSWFQIHLPSHPWVNRARARNNPWYASRAAIRIWRESGWGAWTCARILGIA